MTVRAPRLLAITRGGLQAAHTLPRVPAAFEAILWREHGLSDVALVALVRAAGRPVILHSRLTGAAALAESGRCAGLHLPDGEDVAAWRLRVPGILTASAHDEATVDRALSAGADLVLLAPVFKPASKSDPRTPLGLDRYLAISRGRPVLALAGVTSSRADLIRRRGGWGAAVRGALFTHDGALTRDHGF
jgi:thiamine-phosphate pyrophosphorylase